MSPAPLQHPAHLEAEVVREERHLQVVVVQEAICGGAELEQGFEVGRLHAVHRLHSRDMVSGGRRGKADRPQIALVRPRPAALPCL